MGRIARERHAAHAPPPRRAMVVERVAEDRLRGRGLDESGERWRPAGEPVDQRAPIRLGILGSVFGGAPAGEPIHTPAPHPEAAEEPALAPVLALRHPPDEL